MMEYIYINFLCRHYAEFLQEKKSCIFIKRHTLSQYYFVITVFYFQLFLKVRWAQTCRVITKKPCLLSLKKIFFQNRLNAVFINNSSQPFIAFLAILATKKRDIVSRFVNKLQYLGTIKIFIMHTKKI